MKVKDKEPEEIESNKKLNKSFDYIKIKNITIAILFIIWLIIPLLKEIKITAGITLAYEYQFMEVVGLVGIYLFSYYIYETIKNTKDKKALFKELMPFVLLILYLIWTLISCAFAKDTNKAFYGNSYRKEGYITYLIYGGFFASAFLIKSSKIKKILLNIFLIVTISNIAIIKLVHVNTDLVKYFYFNELNSAVFENLNHYGYYLLLAMMTACFLFIKEKKLWLKILYVLGYIILLYTLILNNTFGSYLAGAITLIIFLIYAIRNKKYIKSTFSAILIFVILSCIVTQNGKNIAMNNFKMLFNDISKILNITQEEKSDNKAEESNKETEENNKTEEINNKTTTKSWEKAGSGRAKLWRYGLIMISQKPILGYGAENLEAEYAKYNVNADRPHNLLIQLATTSGIPGLLLYVSAIAIILFRGIKYLKVDDEVYLVAYFVTLAYLISAMFGNSMYYTSPYFFIFLGFVMNKNEKNT